MTLHFGSSGIRGKYGENIRPFETIQLAEILLHLLGSKLALGRDPRLSGDSLRSAFISGALQVGAELTDYDLIPTPALAYQILGNGESGGVMITASHNPPEYNGFKVFNDKGEALDEPDFSAEGLQIKSARALAYKAGRVQSRQPEEYLDLLAQVKFKKKWRVVIDLGNGATCKLAHRIYSRSVTAIAINSIPDGKFSGRGSEPTGESETTLAQVVKETKGDVGIAFDGDGDRVYIVDEKGSRPLQDRVLGAYLWFLARESSGPFLVPVDASMAVDETLRKQGAKVVRGPVGDAKLLAEMRKERGTFAGEPSGAWIHPQFHPCPDGILSGLLFLQKLEQFDMTVSEAIETVPEYHIVRRSLSTRRRMSSDAVQSLSNDLEKIVGEHPTTETKFGLRVSSENSWVLVRKSGTEPVLRVTVESKQPSEAKRIVDETLDLIKRVSHTASLA